MSFIYLPDACEKAVNVYTETELVFTRTIANQHSMMKACNISREISEILLVDSITVSV